MSTGLGEISLDEALHARHRASEEAQADADKRAEMAREHGAIVSQQKAAAANAVDRGYGLPAPVPPRRVSCSVCGSRAEWHPRTPYAEQASQFGGELRGDTFFCSSRCLPPSPDKENDR